MSTDPSRPPTKLRLIGDAIVSDIAEGRLRSGDRITSERNLALQFGVSLGTVQKVLQALVERGVIERQHGRGTFVRGLGASVDSRYLRFVDVNNRPLQVWWRILQHVPVRPAGSLTRHFGSRAALIRIDRSVDVGGRFTLLSQFFQRKAAFDALFHGENPRDDTNLRELISERLALPTLRVEQHVGFDRLPQDVARVLGAPAQAPCFTLELRGYTVKDQPIYLQRIYGEPFAGATLVIDTQNT